VPERMAERAVAIHVGGVHVARGPGVVRTLLGSCIAACLFEPTSRVGGMNHFLLPRGAATAPDPARFGIHAMERLINRMMAYGADRGGIVAKLFGGGHVLATDESPNSVPIQNVRFIQEFMAIEDIPVVARDLGGSHARLVVFETGTGKAYVRRLRPAAMPTLPRTERRIRRGDVARPKFGDVTMF